MALERRLALPANREDIHRILQSSLSATTRLNEKLEIGNVKYERALDYVNGAGLDPEPSILPNSINVFEAGTPGAMSLVEVESNIDLGRWGLVIGDEVVSLEVRSNLIQAPERRTLTRSINNMHIGPCELG